jgi:twinkle protein
MLVITEGEIDAMSVSQLQGNKWATVSVPNGAQGAAKAIAKRLEWVEKFESVVFMFDMDDVGQKAAQECAAILSPSKAKIARLPLKDANEMLVAGRGKEVIDAIWSAKGWRPDGIVTIQDIYDKVMKPVKQGLPWWCDRLTELTHGRREGEIYTFGAGTGVGKTDFLTQQIEYDLNTLQQPVAAFFLEQNPIETVKRIAGKAEGKRFHVPNETTPEELMAAVDKLQEGGKLHLFDHFGAMQWDDIKSHIRYLAHAEGVKLFYLDHLTALAAADDREEKDALEAIMSEMGSLVQELGIVLHLVSHLTTPEGKPHEEGGRVTIRHFKGSRSIGFWSFFMFGLERNQQAEDPQEKQTTVFRVLKDRLTGQATGETIAFGYEPSAGKLYEFEETNQFPSVVDTQQISEF